MLKNPDIYVIWKNLPLIGLVLTISGVILSLFLLSWHTRLAYDDFSYIGKVQDLGFWQGQGYWYTNWSDRVGATFLITAFGSLFTNTGRVFEYTAFTFVMLLFAAYNLICQTSLGKISGQYTLITSGLLFSLLYILTPNPSQTWYWLTGSATYLWPIIYILYFLSLFLKRQFSLVHTLLACGLTFMTVTSNETVGLLFNLFLLGLIGYSFHASQPKFDSVPLLLKQIAFWLKKPQTVFLVLCQLIAVLAFIILIISPGNAVRVQTENDQGKPLVQSFTQALYQGPLLTSRLIYHQLPVILGLWFCFSIYLSGKTQIQDKVKELIPDLMKKMGIILLLLVIFSIIYPMLSFYVLGSLPPARSHILVCLAICLAFLCSAGYLGKLLYMLQLKLPTVLNLFVLIPILLLFYFSYHNTKTSVIHLNQARIYSQAFDKMYLFLMQKNPTPAVVTVDKLPSSGIILTSGLSEIQDYWVNQRMAGYFHLPGGVRTK